MQGEFFTIGEVSIKYSDLLMSALTLGIGFIGFLQWKWMRKGIDDTNSTNRAFVFLKHFDYRSHFDPTLNKIFWRITPVWENSGNTPTKNLKININRIKRDLSLNADFAFPSAGNSIPILAGPKSLITGDCIDIVGDELTEIQKGTKYFYVWGWAKYSDVFAGTQEHLTKFCYRLNRVTGDAEKHFDTNTNPVQLNFAMHETHNCHDAEI